MKNVSFDLYQWIQSDLSRTYFLLLLPWTYSVLTLLPNVDINCCHCLIYGLSAQIQWTNYEDKKFHVMVLDTTASSLHKYLITIIGSTLYSVPIQLLINKDRIKVVTHLLSDKFNEVWIVRLTEPYTRLKAVFSTCGAFPSLCVVLRHCWIYHLLSECISEE